MRVLERVLEVLRMIWLTTSRLVYLVFRRCATFRMARCASLLPMYVYDYLYFHLGPASPHDIYNLITFRECHIVNFFSSPHFCFRRTAPRTSQSGSLRSPASPASRPLRRLRSQHCFMVETKSQDGSREQKLFLPPKHVLRLNLGSKQDVSVSK